ncbi:maleylpyruvate isomerase family mycothiol-dependent enzyme [Amycolatopsis sp. QT-25]|uniref:maleylpyruvate isomerase family mycothiol-dependent enzyme n=1 Tax=Amycolatopsis sp. QT-25 TaxID=3034022 RepID=UPI0023EAEA3B|nr:maleylpyruvate isomerase family mycothiol-dependent enzyme [Amycolatopsis sp. QT-25]WET81321.1 maleylpyruvate isomerase family mycothiol-dependent enzyme [Amycolatopsis sp. QT-25]
MTSSPIRVPGWNPATAAEGYRQVRGNIALLLTGHAGAGERPVPACPQWTVRELVAHLTQICDRVITRFGGAACPVPESASVAEVLRLWLERGPEADALLDADGDGKSRGDIMVMDAFTHELDLRYALGAPPPEAHGAWLRSFEVLVGGLGSSLGEHGLPGLRIETEGATWIAGTEPVAAVLSGTPVDLYRSLAGRRSPAQIAALAWPGDAEPWLRAFTWGPFAPPDEEIER